MVQVIRGFPVLSISVPFVAGDASKVIVPAPGVGKFLNIVTVNVGITVSAAQTIDIESVGGAVELVKTPASPPVGGQYPFKSNNGYKLPENTALSYVPSAAGNAGLVTVDYYIDGTF